MTNMRLFSSLAIVGSIFAVTANVAMASVYDDAKKVCLERYNDELKSGSVPKGMNRTRYLSQCQNSYVRSVKLENELNENQAANQDGSDAQSKDGQGGPEILPPAPAAHAKKTPPSKPVPRFKPTI